MVVVNVVWQIGYAFGVCGVAKFPPKELKKKKILNTYFFCMNKIIC